MKASIGHKKCILVVEDEWDVAANICGYLEKAGFEALHAADGKQALRIAREELPALIILDLMLPEMSGLEVFQRLKKDPATDRIPVVILSAKSEETDRIVGLELGADDYVTKPFSPRELVLRVNILLRANIAPAGSSEQLKVGEIEIDRSRFEVKAAGKPVDLTATEFKLLTLLAERCGRLQTRDALLDEVWGDDAAIESRTVDTHVKRLRERLGPAGRQIETIRAFGYRMTADPKAA